MLLDIHTHIDMYQESELSAALDEIRKHRIFSISNSIDIASYQKNCELAKASELIIPAFGIHPWSAPEYSDRLEELVPYIENSLFIGEIGLDYHFRKDPDQLEAQRKVFDFLLGEAKKRDKLVIVHTKGAEEDVLAYLRSHNIQRAVIHWYSGPVETYRKMAEEGYRFSIGFMVQYSDFIRVIARRIPDGQLFVETDNPGGYHWKHNKPGMPGLIAEVVREVARIRNQSHEEIKQLVWENFMNMLTQEERQVIMQVLNKRYRSLCEALAAKKQTEEGAEIEQGEAWRLAAPTSAINLEKSEEEPVECLRNVQDVISALEAAEVAAEKIVASETWEVIKGTENEISGAIAGKEEEEVSEEAPLMETVAEYPEAAEPDVVDDASGR